jgi:drug/metabolite transporter (DMT)-like permease
MTSTALPLGSVLLVLMSAFLHACWNALIKTSGDRLVLLTAVIAVSSLVGIVALPFVGWPGWQAVPWLAGSVAVHVVYYWCLLSAYRTGDLSEVYPVARGAAPLVTAFVAFMILGEGLRPMQIGGVLMVSLGVLVIAVIRAGGIRNSASLGWALAVSCCIAAYSTVDSAGVRAADSGLAYIAWLLTVDSIPLVLFTVLRRRGALLPQIRRSWKACLGGGLISGISYGAAVWVFQFSATAGVVALRETSVLFAALIGVFFLGERFGPRRIAAAAIVATGVIMISIY